MRPDVAEVPELVAEFNRVVRRLGELVPGRKFTLDGHLVGSVGEAIAAHRFRLGSLRASAEGHGTCAADGRPVQMILPERSEDSV